MSKNIIDIYKKYLNGSINRIELDRLLLYFNQATEAELRTLMDQAFVNTEESPLVENTESIRRVQIRLQEHTAVTASNSRRSLNWVFYAAAALLFFLGFYLLFPGNKTVEYYAPKPMLSIQTADGEVIDIVNQEDSIWTTEGIVFARIDSQTVQIKSTKNAAFTAVDQTISTDRSDFNIILEDGSKVTLNANSSIRLQVPFASDKRDIILSGEGYFDVTHDANRPFQVRAAHTLVRVLGTQFNIRSYSEEQQVETALFKGKIGLSQTTGGQEIILTPGQKAVSTVKGVQLSEGKATPQITAWRDRYFSYDEQKLTRVLLDICRWYGTTLDMHTVPKDKKIYMKIEKSLPLSEVLDLLSETSDLFYEVKGGKIAVRPIQETNNQQYE